MLSQSTTKSVMLDALSKSLIPSHIEGFSSVAAWPWVAEEGLLPSLVVAGYLERVFGPHGKSWSWQELHLWPGQVRFVGIHYKSADLVRISTMRHT